MHACQKEDIRHPVGVINLEQVMTSPSLTDRSFAQGITVATPVAGQEMLSMRSAL